MLAMKSISYFLITMVFCFIITRTASAKICEVTTYDITPSKMVLEIGTVGTITITAKGENNCLAEGIEIIANTIDGITTTDDDYVSVSPVCDD